ncbi:DNA glycosylase [Agrocybe pediades]|nr:DNA glycosylase [Agrocybe pediades]
MPSSSIRTTSSLDTTRRTTRLTSRVSTFNPQVTLFEAADLEDQALPDSSPSPRRSKRVKVEVKTETESHIPDLEDLKYVPKTRTPRKTPKKEEEQLYTLQTSAVKAEASTSSTATPTPRKRKKADVASPKKPKAVPQALAVPHPEPPNWRETYNAIKEMRTRFVAPVDTMGCQQAQLAEKDPKNRRYATLVSLMLSSQTKDEITNAAVDNLRAALGGSITIEGMIAADDAVIQKAIAKVGFWSKKTTYLKQAAIKLRDEFDSDVPDTADKLCSLPGVGPKMAFLALQIAWNQNDGIGVDVHVHRITNLLGWHKPPTKTPEQTRLNLQSWLPKELYGDINHMLVGFGQVICVPVSPRCDVCELSVKGLCPSARVVNSKKRKAIVFTEVKESPPKIEITMEEETEEKKFIPPPSPSRPQPT